ncbi:YitT family protein [Dysosmobacter sp. Sow4_B12]|uniref:YitT family protein n=1 Tax=Dysosmobacter sp. Sow4_B12 TaxID=3438777 RepID=UPI003F8F2396
MKQRASLPAVLSRLRPLNFLLLLAAGTVNAVGVTMFLAPVHLYDSGISGTSMLLWQVTPEEYTLSLFLLLLNIPLFLFGLKRQGAVFTIYSVWAVFVYAAASFVITDLLPVDVSTASPFAGQDLLLCALFGGLKYEINEIAKAITLSEILELQKKSIQMEQFSNIHEGNPLKNSKETDS